MKIKNRFLVILLIFICISAIFIIFNFFRPAQRVKRSTISMLNNMIDKANSSSKDYFIDLNNPERNKGKGFHINSKANLIIIRDVIKRSRAVDISGVQEKPSLYGLYAGDYLIGSATSNSARLTVDDDSISVYFSLTGNDQLSINKMIQSIKK